MAHFSASPIPALHETAARPAVEILLAAPRGFCAGVRRAVDAVDSAIDRFGAPVYVRRAIVHNMEVVRALERRGAIFVEELDEVPTGAVVIFSAHGVAREIEAQAETRGLRWFDAVCPLVRKVHREVAAHHQSGRRILLIGHDGHPEVIGTTGRLAPGQVTLVRNADEVAGLDLDRDAPVAYAVQTTFSADEAHDTVAALEARFSDLAGPRRSDICYATTNRQAAAKAIAGRVEAMLVAGDPLSSNAARLCEVALLAGCPRVDLVASADEIDWEAFGTPASIGITAAASAPEHIVDGLLEALRSRFDTRVEEAGAVLETTVFKPLEFG
ncbi:MAG: 4-hydroxy-3-methylbut-2-enyl diphosphate reductase [Alphaproteobacteria bacterium]|nr:4-hydroxy-3-methylbut-2-enyl diphosphate reductase [Alphaproteobacteria bacterium]